MSDSSVSGGIVDPTELAFLVGELENTPWCPLALTASESRQPVPRDLPPGLDPSSFTYKDAFEDLLAVSGGCPLPKILWRSWLGESLRLTYPGGEPFGHWMFRLEMQGLILRPEQGTVRPSFAETIYGGLAAEAEELRRSIHAEQQRERLAGFFRSAAEKQAQPRTATSDQQESGPEHENDLFAALESADAAVNGSWEALKRELGDLKRRAGQVGSSSAQQNENLKTPHPGDEVNRWVDLFGNTHITVKRKVLNEDGKEVGTFVHHSINARDESDAIENSDTASEDDEKKKKKGWFR